MTSQMTAADERCPVSSRCLSRPAPRWSWLGNDITVEMRLEPAGIPAAIRSREQAGQTANHTVQVVTLIPITTAALCAAAPRGRP